jgi:glycosyltransferase involved in cell wall biosynthesis
MVRLLFVGRLEERKGIDILLAALPICLSANDKLWVDIIGADLPRGRGLGTYSEAFRQKHGAQDWARRVRFHGELARASLEQKLAACDMFVAPSRYESFGLVLVEAMRYGKACISSDIGGITEIVEEGVTGLLTPRGDVAALAKAISRLADDDRLRADMGVNGLRRYQQKFTNELQASRAVAAYRAILAAEKKPPLNNTPSTL